MRRTVLWASTIFVVGLLVRQADAATVKFYCHDYTKNHECAFSIQMPNGYTNFIVPAGGLVEQPAAYKGDRYCVSAGPIRQPALRWPQCWAASGSRIVRDVND